MTTIKPLLAVRPETPTKEFQEALLNSVSFASQAPLGLAGKFFAGCTALQYQSKIDIYESTTRSVKVPGGHYLEEHTVKRNPESISALPKLALDLVTTVSKPIAHIEARLLNLASGGPLQKFCQGVCMFVGGLYYTAKGFPAIDKETLHKNDLS